MSSFPFPFVVQYQERVEPPRVEAPPAPAPELSWAPEFPDFARRATLPVACIAALVVAAPLEPPTPPLAELSWQPSYPEQTRRKPAAAEFQSTAYVPALNRWGLDALPWLPAYPDQPARARRPLNSESLTTVAYVPALNRWGLDALPWLPTFPDFARASPAAIRWAGWISFVPDLASFALPAPLCWSPEFPDRVPRVASRIEAGLVAPFEQPAPSVPQVSSWSPTAPEQVATRRSAPASSVAHPVDAGAPLPVPALSWAPAFPDFARAALRPGNVGGWFSELGALLVPFVFRPQEAGPGSSVQLGSSSSSVDGGGTWTTAGLGATRSSEVAGSGNWETDVEV